MRDGFRAIAAPARRRLLDLRATAQELPLWAGGHVPDRSYRGVHAHGGIEGAYL